MNKQNVQNLRDLKGMSKKMKLKVMGEILQYNGRKFYTYEKQGSGRYSRQAESQATNRVITVLRELRVDFTWENEAPRGGLLGEYITYKLTPAKVKKLANIIENF